MLVAADSKLLTKQSNMLGLVLYRCICRKIAVKDVVEYPYVVVGWGASETIVSQRIRERSNSLSGKLQLEVEKFADSIESISLVLAENAGMNVIDT